MLACYVAGRSLNEVAALAHVSTGTVWNHLKRAGVVRSRSEGNTLAHARRIARGAPASERK